MASSNWSGENLAYPAFFTNLLTNGGFETGTFTGWVNSQGGSETLSVVGSVTDTYPSPHTATPQNGRYQAQLGRTDYPNAGNGTSFIYQAVVVPATGTTTLTFWGFFVTADSVTFDQQTALVQDNTGTTLITIFNQCITQGWTKYTTDLTPYAGTTVRIYFSAHDDSAADPTYMMIDSVAVTNSLIEPALTVNKVEKITGGGAAVKMRGFDTTLGQTVFWYAFNVDPNGLQYTGAGPLTDVVWLK